MGIEIGFDEIAADEICPMLAIEEAQEQYEMNAEANLESPLQVKN